jgi:hypothetical protein
MPETKPESTGPAEDRDGSAQRPVSERKLHANRANAQQSTGPRTPEGKWRSGRNPVRHGILAREVVIGEGDGAERAEDFADLQAGLYAAHAPRDAAEQLEVENLVAAYWMLRRAFRATTGDTRSGLDTVRRDWEQRRREHFEELLGTAGLDHGVTLRTSSLGCAHLLRLVAAVTAALTTGHISDRLLGPFLEFFPAAASAPSTVRIDGKAGEEGRSFDEEVCGALAALLAEERVELERAKTEAEGHERAELSAEAARLALPGADAAVRDLRYLTALRRDIARAQKMLAMLQQRPSVEPQDANAAGAEGSGAANELERRE